MSDTGVNALDLLDTLRELPADEQERRLAALPAAMREQLRSWLKAAQRPADPFDAVATALAGADAELLSKLRANLSKLRDGSSSPELNVDPWAAVRTDNSPPDLKPGSNTTIPVSAGAIGAAKGVPAHRRSGDGRLAFQAGDVVFKQFRIVCQLGRGGMGEVFRAIDEHAGEQVALKFLPGDRMANAEALSLLKSEVRVAHLVRSPYVCSVHGLYLDTDPPPGRRPLPPFISMQFIEGEDLDTLLKRVERLSGPKVVRIAHELVKGMAAIHAAGILHRDLKPANVMLDVHGTVQILDFGIASIAKPDSPDSATIAGTPAYMAPESRTRPATPQSDIYALGLLLFELTTGQMASELIAQNIQPISILEQHKDQIPRGLIDAIVRCLRIDPGERFQSMDELLLALPAAAPAPGTRRESISTIAKSDSVAPFRPWAVVAIMAFVIAAGIGVFIMPARPGSTAAAPPTRDPAELLGGAKRNFAKIFGAQDDAHAAYGFASMPAAGISKQTTPEVRQPVYFWYRCAAGPIEPASAINGLSVSDPPSAPGITTIKLDADEVLIEAWRVPELGAKPGPGEPGTLPSDLEEVLKRRSIGQLNGPMKRASAADLPAGWIPPATFPSGTEYWMEPAVGQTSGDGKPPVVVAKPLVVALYGPRVVYIGRPMAGASQPKVQTTKYYAFWWLYALPVLGLGLAVRNVRLRRCDTHHALRVAGVVFVLSLLGWVLMTHPAVVGDSMRDRWNTGIGIALFVAAEAWISYAAVDPYARLTWKRCLIGYARLTAGWPKAITRDVIVGRSILAGAAFGLSLALFLKLVDRWSMNGVSADRDQLAATLLGNGFRTAGFFFRSASTTIVFALLQFVTLVLLHWITRRRVTAVTLFCVVTPLLWAVYRNDFGFPGYLVYPAIGILTAIALIHEGVLTMALGLFFSSVLTTVPFTFNPAAPNFGISVMVLLFLSLIVICGLIAVIPGGITSRWWPSDPIRFATMDP